MNVLCTPSPHSHMSQRGNVLFMILIAVVLIGLLTAALQSGNNTESAQIDDETLAIRISEVGRTGAELERAVQYVLQNGTSETDIRFSHVDAPSAYADSLAPVSAQIFNKSGGGAAYPAPPPGINDGSKWEFYGGTAIPGMGTSAPDLVAVLPNVTDSFCSALNAKLGQNAPVDNGTTPASGTNPGSCVNIGALGRFGSTQKFYSATVNAMDTASFAQDTATSTVKPAPQACVTCSLDQKRYYYYVLLAR
jgi:hypothetical protein